MAQLLRDRLAPSRFSNLPQQRFHAAESSLPEKPVMECCPRCNHSLEKDEPHTVQKLRSGVRQLFSAVFAIVLSLLRLARLIAAVVFSLLGVIGFGFQNLSRKVAHPHDVRLLPRLREERTQRSTR